jgi:hypothetical protein
LIRARPDFWARFRARSTGKWQHLLVRRGQNEFGLSALSFPRAIATINNQTKLGRIRIARTI